ncbi:hypothetical protein FHG87_016818 [Trinorchestia longiramus]|nr:hypothetical protein FHG87_016818 [Trinorchestia longiramus]
MDTLQLWRTHSNSGHTPTLDTLQLWAHSNYGHTPTLDTLQLWTHSNYGHTPTLEDTLQLWTHSNSGHTPTMDTLPVQGRVGDQDGLSLSEVHEHLIRSPPPTALPKSVPLGVFVFPNETPDNKLCSVPGSRALSLNPLVTRGHEDVLDLNLRQILDTQKQLHVPKGEGGQTSGAAGLSSSVPGSPVRGTGAPSGRGSRSPVLHSKADEASTVLPASCLGTSLNSSLGSFLASSSSHQMHFTPLSSGTNLSGVAASSLNNSSAGLAPLVPPFRRQTPQSVTGDGVRDAGTTEIIAASPALRPILPKAKRSMSSTRPEISTVSAAMLSSSSTLTLPIRCPHAPAAQASDPAALALGDPASARAGLIDPLKLGLTSSKAANNGLTNDKTSYSNTSLLLQLNASLTNKEAAFTSAVGGGINDAARSRFSSSRSLIRGADMRASDRGESTGLKSEVTEGRSFVNLNSTVSLSS